MSLIAATRIGSYEVAAQIGVGGMGEVYRAGFRRFTASVVRFGDRKTRETHYSYIEKRSRHDSRHKPRIIVFKETGTQIDVRVYRPK